MTGGGSWEVDGRADTTSVVEAVKLDSTAVESRPATGSGGLDNRRKAIVVIVLPSPMSSPSTQVGRVDPLILTNHATPMTCQGYSSRDSLSFLFSMPRASSSSEAFSSSDKQRNGVPW